MRYIGSKNRIFRVLLSLSAALFFCLVLDTAALQREISANVLRMHITANSDSEADQAAKLAVRDAVLEYTAPLLAGCRDRNEAEAQIRASLEDISRCADSAARGIGQSGARASLTTELFPRREYGLFSLPAGYYSALRITVGTGAGHNWWCVIFPELCLPAASSPDEALAAAGLSSDGIHAVTAEPEVRFFLLDLFYDLRSLLR